MAVKAQRIRAERLSPERRVTSIVEAAQNVFRFRGYYDALVSEIANNLGVVEGTIYRYFPTKRDLLVAVVVQWYRENLAVLAKEKIPSSSAAAALRFLIWKHLDLIHRDPDMCRLTLVEIRAQPDYLTSEVFQLNRQYTQTVVDAIERGRQNGEFRSDISLRILRDMIFGCVEHHTWAYLRGGGDFRPSEAAEMIVDLIVNGLHENH